MKAKCISFFENNRNFYIVLFCAMLVRSFPFGFQYFAFSDDFNAYGVYSLYQGNLWLDVVLRYTLYGFRPLAGLLDAYVISRFWDNLAFVLFGITGMQFATIWLLDKVFARSGLIWGRVAAVFFAFFPTLTESAYWISASARIVTTAFFCTLAAFAMLKFIYKEGRYWFWFALALLSGLLAQGFYEQGILFTFVVTLGLLILHRKALPRKALFAWPFVNLAIIGTHYFIFRDVSQLGPRSEMADNLFSQIPLVADRIVTTFIREQSPTIYNTIRWGLGQLFTEHLFLVIWVALFSSLLTLFIIFDKRAILESGRKTLRSLLAGLLLTLSTLVIFFFLAESWVWVRNFFYVIIGLAVFVEIAARAVRHIHIGVTIGKAIAAFCAIFIFFSGFILEVNSIRLVEHYDRQIVSALIKEMERSDSDSEAELVWFFGLKVDYGRQQINPRISSQIRLDWALDGIYLALTQTPSRDRPHWVVPIMHGQETEADFDRDILFGLDADLAVRALHFEDGFLIFQDSGEAFGLIDPHGIFLMEE